MYWNGFAWATAGGTTATGNAATLANTNVASLGKFSFKAFFRSSGTSGCELNQVSLGGTD